MPCTICLPRPSLLWQKKLEAHGEVFIPIRVAKNKVGEVQRDMLAQREKHIWTVKQVEGHYKDIAREQEEYYLAYIERLNRAAQERDQQQCSLLAKVRNETDSYRTLAESKCRELEDEVAALQGEIAARDEYIATTRDAMSTMQSESDAQLMQDADNAAGLRGQIGRLILAGLAPELSQVQAEAAQLQAQVEEGGRDAEAEERRLREELLRLVDELEGTQAKLSSKDQDHSALEQQLADNVTASASALSAAEVRS